MISTVSGYTGGDLEGPSYHTMGDHSEAVLVVYDPGRVTYGGLLQVFWSAHDPFNNIGWAQYRNGVFPVDAEQHAAVDASIRELEETSGRKVETYVARAGPFFAAEDYHQKYLLRQNGPLFRELRGKFATEAEFLASTAAARVNGYLGGYGSAEQMRREIDLFDFSAAVRGELLTVTGIVVR